MALETERCSPQNASSPGPNDRNKNPDAGGSGSGCAYSGPVERCQSRTPPNKSPFQGGKIVPSSTGCEESRGDLSSLSSTISSSSSERKSSERDLASKRTPIGICSPLQHRTSFNVVSKGKNVWSEDPETDSDMPDCLTEDTVSRMSLPVRTFESDDDSRVVERGVHRYPLVEEEIMACEKVRKDFTAVTVATSGNSLAKNGHQLEAANDGVVAPDMSRFPYGYHPALNGSELYGPEIRNLAAVAAAASFPLNPFLCGAVNVLPYAAAAAAAHRLPPLNPQLYNHCAGNFNAAAAAAAAAAATDYMVGQIQNAKIMCQVLQIQNTSPNGGVPGDKYRPLVIPKVLPPYGKVEEWNVPGKWPGPSPSCTIAIPAATTTQIPPRPGSSCSSSNGLCGARETDLCCSPAASSSSKHPSSPTFSLPSASPLPFSVDNILKPEFGKVKHFIKEDAASSVFNFHHLNNINYNNNNSIVTNNNVDFKFTGKDDIRGRNFDKILSKRKSTGPQQSRILKSAKISTGASSALQPTKIVEESPVTMSTTGAGKTATADAKEDSLEKDAEGKAWPAWVYCTRYSDRPSSGPRSRRLKRSEKKEEKRPRTAFSGDQLNRLKREFAENHYLTERRRQQLANELGLNEAQIKIWFQNKRAKIKKSSGVKNPLALKLMAQGLYNHSTVPMTDDEDDDDCQPQQQATSTFGPAAGKTSFSPSSSSSSSSSFSSNQQSSVLSVAANR